MKIAIFATRYHINQHYWVEALVNDGHSVNFYVTTKEKSEFYSAINPIVTPQRERPTWQKALLVFAQGIKNVPVRDQFNYTIDYSWLKKTVQDYNPDLIIVRDLFFPQSLSAFRIAKQLNIKCIHYNQYPLEPKEPLITRLAKKFQIAAKTRITPSRENEMERNPDSNSWYVPLVTTINFDLSNKTYLKNDVFKILFIGKYKLERKNHLLMLEAISKLASQNQVHLTIVGSDVNSNLSYFKKIKEKISSLKLEKVVTLLDDVPYEKMGDIYKEHDVFVLPSKNEPYAISPIEAMSYGLPVILTESNGGKNIIAEGETGYIIPDDDVNALVDCLMKMCTSSELIYKMGHAAHNRRERLFSSKNFTFYLEKVVANLETER